VFSQELLPVDIVLLLDASGSMRNDFTLQSQAAAILVDTLWVESGHSSYKKSENGATIGPSETFQTSVIQWSGARQIFINSQLQNDMQSTLDLLNAPLTQEFSGGTRYAGALVQCYDQMKTRNQTDSYKLCALLTDGANQDGENFVYENTTRVYESCQAMGIVNGSTAPAAQCTTQNIVSEFYPPTLPSTP
jgi:hypothetical protein